MDAPRPNQFWKTGDDTAHAAGLFPSRISERCLRHWEGGIFKRKQSFPVPGHVCYLSLITERLLLCFLRYMLSLSCGFPFPGVHFLTWRNIQSWVQTPFSFGSQSVGRTCSFLAGYAVPWFPLNFFAPVPPRQTRREIAAEPPNRSSNRELQT